MTPSRNHPPHASFLQSAPGKARCLLLVGLSFVTTSCFDSDPSISSTDLTEKIETLRETHAAAENKNTALLEAQNKAIAAREEAKNSIGEQIQASADLEARRIELGEELNKIRDEFNAYRANYGIWARSAAKGYVFPSVNIGDGNVLTQAKITSLDATTLGLTTSATIKAVPLEQLSPILRDQLGYDPNAIGGAKLSILEKAELDIREAQVERAEQSKKFKEMLRERNRFLDQEDALLADNFPVPDSLSERIDELQVALKISNDRSAQLIKIMNWNIMLINNGGVPPPGPRPH